MTVVARSSQEEHASQLARCAAMAAIGLEGSSPSSRAESAARHSCSSVRDPIHGRIRCSLSWDMACSDELTELALAAGGGDRGALSEFIRCTQDEVWRYLARMVSAAEADDLVQETYLRVVTGLAGFQGRSSVRVWLLSISRRVVIDRLRRASTRPLQLATDPAELPDLQAEQVDPFDRLGLAEFLGELDIDRRDALVMTQLMGFSYAETAEICGCAIGTVRSRVARARADLMTVLGRQVDECGALT